MSHVIIDRRKNGKGKSTANRTRLFDRVRERARKTVKNSIQKGNITDITKDKSEKIHVPKEDIDEPTFQHDNGGVVKRVLPGNKKFITGDRIPRPEGGGKGRGGKGSPDGEGNDDFEFTISNSEYMDIFYEDLELPNLEERVVASTEEYTWKRAGFVTEGDPARLDLIRTMTGALGRRRALGSKKRKQIKELEKEINSIELSITGMEKAECSMELEKIRDLQAQIDELKEKLSKIPFIDEIDLRFRNRVKVPCPVTQAVMFCIMDVSGSMDEWHKEMAKRFYMLLYIFLTKNYEKIDVVFIRHHTMAKEVDEDEFFHSKETGGTRVSPALDLTNKIIQERYPKSNWNIYVCQASDGDNWPDDNYETTQLLENNILPLSQYYAYIEINKNNTGDLWIPYRGIKERNSKKFAMAKITEAADIYPVFRGLFKKDK